MEPRNAYNPGVSPSVSFPKPRRKSISPHPNPTMYSHIAASSSLFDTDGKELHRHPDLWFDDGSVICRAENTLFFVHMSQLSRHSVCFKDMFSIGTQSNSDAGNISIRSKNGTTEYPECPVITLHDSAEDVGNLFTALYDGPNFGNNDRDDFRVVSGVLRLSSKYIIDSLREKAILHLSQAWPTTLKAWDAREDNARAFEMKTGSSSGHVYPSPIAVINLAREVDAPTLLPSAFYDLCRYPFSQIFEPSEDDPLYIPLSKSDSDPTSSPALSPTGFPSLESRYSRFPTPSASSIRNSGVQLQSALSFNAQNVNHTALIPSNPNHNPYHIHFHHHRRSSSNLLCISAAACRKDFSELVELATQHYVFDRERGFSDPLYVAEELGQLKSAEFSNSDAPECKACARSLELWAARERERIWRMVPVWFRLSTDVGAERAASPPVVDIGA
ncbi:hypothetical protein D9758_015483 [Tetrapyrgos nigripes]|uniref:BTB domain-containing protein n=1 Tax=Tetrapyrgos nigripes TaxID=182062 RepID=A0A8H5FCE8_9AGAR|nr:hypothetical protein D9758_015483 [Tetrapyrgos nigripes]